MYTRIERGESVCFPIYNERQKPVGWRFIGYTVD